MIIHTRNRWLIRLAWGRWDVPSSVGASHKMWLWWLSRAKKEIYKMLISRLQLLPRTSTMRLIRSIWFPMGLGVGTMSLGVYYSHLVGHATILSLLAVFIGFIFVMDAAARLSMYLYYATTDRVLNSLRVMMNCRKSFCSRQVAIALYGKVAQKFYSEMGYRWYHVLPDATFSLKTPFLRFSFWKAVFNPKLP